MQTVELVQILRYMREQNEEIRRVSDALETISELIRAVIREEYIHD